MFKPPPLHGIPDSPSTRAVLDAQAARSGSLGVEGVRGYNPAKRVVGRKRHALTDTDTDGRLLMAAISLADLHDGHDEFLRFLNTMRPRCQRAS